MNKPWFMYDICVPFGDPNFDTLFGSPHDLDIGAPPNYPVTALLPGTIASISTPQPSWGKQIGVRLDSPYKGVPFFAFLHLSAVNPELVVGRHVAKGDVIGWVGGGSDESQYTGTSNPTGQNFLNTSVRSSRIQVGIALIRGPEYGFGSGWENWTAQTVDWSLDPTPILHDARQEFMNEGEDDMLQITSPFASRYFTQVADNRWRCDSKNLDVFAGILQFYRSIGGSPRLPLTGELQFENVTYQVFESGVIVFDPEHKLDNPPGFSPAYLLKLDSELAKKILH